MLFRSAPGSGVLLVGLALGRREAVIVGAAVVLTLTATLFASWAWGFTLNRVSLFALIFSIGILVDDAIVVVENVERNIEAGLTPRDILRKRGTPYEELGLSNPKLDYEAILDAIEQHPILIERPILVTDKGVRLCRPIEKMNEIMPG